MRYDQMVERGWVIMRVRTRSTENDASISVPELAHYSRTMGSAVAS
jgi:hypothetical protein